MIPALVLIAAYLIGGIPFGYLLVRVTTGRDVRASGSGNIGATNVLRTAGRGIAIATLLLDAGKAFFAVWLAAVLLNNSPLWCSAAAIAAMLGHAFPIYLKFKGGKAVASFLGAFLYLTPLPLLAVLIVFIVVVSATRYISLGSVIAAGTFPLAVWLILHPALPVILAAITAAVLIIARHRANIVRIRAGSEHVFSVSRRAGGR